jgi:hypothetical protein
MTRLWLIVVIGLEELLWSGSNRLVLQLDDLRTLRTELATLK